ncbi:MAG TPA: apolipoprotein N-acyltransferase [Nevskiaceae bacterium]|nr:apolipoprotein N-acyltransferase [Nevskiaceae bacterium]
MEGFRVPPALQRFELIVAPLLGAIATLGFAPFSFWYAPVLALAFLFLLCADRTWKRAALLGWLFGIAHFATGVYWIFISTHVYGGAPFWLGLLLCAVLFSYMALYPALVCGAATRLGVWRAGLGFAALPALWVLSELLRGWIYSGFPWLSLGIVALDQPAERFAPIIGEHGLSALYVLCAYALFRMAGASRRQWVACVAIAFSPLLGMALPDGGSWTRDDGAAMPVAIVQGNVPQDEKWLRGKSEEILARYQAMTLAALDAKLVAWPEVVPNQPFDLVPDYFAALDEAARARGSTLLAGVLIREEDDAIYNSMLAVGRSQGRYDKRHLVPFGEYFPIPAWLRPIMDVLGTPYSDFSSGGARFNPIDVEGHRVGISICFEDVFGAEFVRESRDAAFLVNATNDAWFARSSEPHQHLAIARLRALETGRWLVRATNTGLSAYIRPDGRVASRSGHYTTEILRGEIVPRAGLTPYARWTNAPLWVGSVVVIAVCVIGAIRRRAKVNAS